MGAHPTGRNAEVTPLPDGILLSFCTSLGSLFGPLAPAMAQVAGDVLVGSRRRVVLFEITAATSEVFRGSRAVELPFDRIAASVWLEPGDGRPRKR